MVIVRVMNSTHIDPFLTSVIGDERYALLRFEDYSHVMNYMRGAVMNVVVRQLAAPIMDEVEDYAKAST